MAAPGGASAGVALRQTLRLAQIAKCDIFTGSEPGVTPWGKVYGGQVFAQALAAAQRTVAAGLHVHSAHGYFILSGESGVELLFEVERVRDGASFATRTVKAVQRNKPIFTLIASFHRDEPGLEFQLPNSELIAVARSRNLARIPTPEELLRAGAAQVSVASGADTDGSTQSVDVAEGDHWSLRYVRHAGRLGDGVEHAAVLAWMSDARMCGTVWGPHQAGGAALGMTTSLDHSVHFHRPFRADEWLLLHSETRVSAGARGIARMEVYDRAGVLVATCTQEALVRPTKGTAAARTVSRL